MTKRFQNRGRRFLGIGVQGAIKSFFGGNALLSIAILLLICVFLGKEAALFFPKHHEGLQLYRNAGLEYVDLVKRQVEGHTTLNSLVAQAYFAELDEIAGRERSLVEGFANIAALAEDLAEDEIDAWAEARDELEEARGEHDTGALALAQKTETEAHGMWNERIITLVAGMERDGIDAYGRLTDEDLKALTESLPDWDPVEEIPPALVARAEADLKAKMAAFEEAKNAFAESVSELRRFKEQLRARAMEVKAEAVADQSSAARKEALLAGADKELNPEARRRRLDEAARIVIRDSFPFDERTRPFYQSKPEHARLAAGYLEKFQAAYKKLPVAPGSPQALAKLRELRAATPDFLRDFERDSLRVREWRHDKPYGRAQSVAMFFFGREWVTNSSWQDFYGLLPLLAGSLVISVIALLVAVPFSVGAAIYVNKLAHRWERNLIKPAIEFVQAIPSIVLGFFGIMVLGTFLRELSQEAWLAWVPGFPMQERLNILNAGLLLALMAVPTIFTLCEDALDNVPQSFTDASLALGASKIQTILRVLLPAAVSGILAAVLLGFGRVIGETMVVLLVAGNQISIPDFSQGLGVVTQPAHTMTGIIAQETGEVNQGSLHWRALFMVGLILFAISLGINWLAQKVIHRFQYS